MSPDSAFSSAVVFYYFSGTTAYPQRPQGSGSKAKVTKRLQAISLILLTGMRTKKGWGEAKGTTFEIQKLFQVLVRFETEQKAPIRGTSKYFKNKKN